MKYIKRFFILLVLLDNFLSNFPKKLLFRNRWVLEGKCKQCGICCQEILLKITQAQLASPLFRTLAIKWTCWLFDFILLSIDYGNNYLVFTCKNRLPSGKCGNYFWRPNICRNYPLVDYFDEPKMLPNCGFTARRR